MIHTQTIRCIQNIRSHAACRHPPCLCGLCATYLGEIAASAVGPDKAKRHNVVSGWW